MSDPRHRILANTLFDPVESEEIRRSVRVTIETNTEECLRDPSGREAQTSSYESSPPRVIEFVLPRANYSGQVHDVLRHHGQLSDRLSESLTDHIATTDTEVDSSIAINLIVILTYEKVYGLNLSFKDLLLSVSTQVDLVGRLVRDGAVDDKESLELGLESEECSICFDNLLASSDKAPTRMSCSHVFHDRCLSHWLYLNNSCPLCRQELYVDTL